jgi:poly(3-hydroxybutyrate) depolymerase
MRKTLTFLSIFLANLTLAQTTQTGNISVTSTLQTNNPRSRSFTFRLPSNQSICNRPLLIALHGDGGTGSGLMSYTGFNALADANNFIAVYPDAQNTVWGVQWNKYADNAAGFAAIPDPNAADDVQFISDLIDYFYNTYGINRSTVYVTGHSGGGYMAYHLAIANLTKNKIAGIAPVAASLWGENNFLNTQFGVTAYVQTPVLHLHSPTDGTVAYPTTSNGWTWPLSQFSNRNCSTAAYTTTAVTPTIDKHTFCGTGNKVILMRLKKASLGHGWPTLANADYDGSQEIWNFLSTFSKGTYTNNPATFNVTSTNPASYTANQQLKTSEFITTQAPPNIIINNANSNNLIYQAGKAVTLNTGLEVSQGAVFTAKIGGCITNTIATAPTMYVQGRNLYDVLGNQVVPVGLNIPTDYWQFSGTNDQVSQFSQTGANMARIIWFQNGIVGASHTNTDLDQLITKLTNQRIFSVVALWDGANGCPNNPNQLNNANGYVSWFIDPARVTLLNNHKKHVILNLMNELGFGYSYNANNTADVVAFANWRNQYKIAITSIRNAGLHMPIMIDAPLCGGSLNLVNQAAAEIIAHDPDHNIIFSIHTYWAENNETNQIVTSVTNNVPIIIGEVANKQVGADNWNTNPATGYSECYYGIDGTNSEHAPPSGFSYKNLLPNALIPNNIGYLFWEWTNDACNARRMSTDGNFSNLTIYGTDAVNNVNYGILNKAVRSSAGAF